MKELSRLELDYGILIKEDSTIIKEVKLRLKLTQIKVNKCCRRYKVYYNCGLLK